MKVATPVGVLALGMSVMLGCSPTGSGTAVPTTRQSALNPVWGSIGSLSQQRVGLTTTLLPSGGILIAGGKSNLGPTRSAEHLSPGRAEFTAVGEMGADRVHHTATALRDGRVLIAGGKDATGALSSTEIYDPATRMFAPAASLALARESHTATTLDSGRILIAGGGSAITELFDPVAGTFTTGPSMSLSRTGHTATRLLDGRVLIVAGAGAASLKGAEIYDPAAAGGQGAFTSTGSLVALEPRLHTATLLSDGRVLVVGGCRPPDPCNCASVGGPPTCVSARAAEIFDPSLAGGVGGFTTVAASTLEMRQAHTASLLPSGEVLLVGGGPGGDLLETPPQLTNSAELFDPGGATFSAAGSLGASRGGHTATVLPTGGVMVAGGADPSLLDERVEFLTNPGAFAPASQLTVGRVEPTATLLRSGRVLIAGGEGVNATPTIFVHSSSEQFDPATGKFVKGADMGSVRVEHSATALADGSVLIAGGRDGADVTLASSERFVPGAGAGQGSFSADASLGTARRGHTATMLPDRSVLVTGGFSGPGTVRLSSAEVFTTAGGFVSLSPAMTTARAEHAAVLLETGKVLIVGGSSAELYDPVTQSFSPTGAPIGNHEKPRVALLPNGDVLLVGQAAAVGELYHPSTEQFSATSPLVESFVVGRSVHSLPSGSVLLAGGFQFVGYLGIATIVAELFIPNVAQGKGRFVRTGDMSEAHREQASSVLADGRALIFGGTQCTTVCPPHALTTATSYADPIEVTRRPLVNTLPPTTVGGAAMTITGSGFAPALDASQGSTASSPSNVPTAIWMPETGQGHVAGSVTTFTDTSLTCLVPATALHGHGRLFVTVNGIVSEGSLLELLPGALGAPCGATAACSSGFCADGVCCDTACAGACKACTSKRKGGGQDGVCGDIPPELDATDSCPLSNGAACTSAVHCGSGLCVDGVCCDKACAGQCEACDEPNALGQCIAVTGAPRGQRTACAQGTAGNPCSAETCDGLETTQCGGLVGAEVECAPGSCSAGVATPAASCDGQGSCGMQKSVSCAPANCDGLGCGSGSCRDSEDCHPDYRCSKGVGADVGECVLANATECDGDHTLTSADGNTQDCSPYRCTQAGACITKCTSSLECVRGRACSAGGDCVADTSTTETSAGCGCRSAGQRPSGDGAWLALGVVALAIRRRRPARRRA